MRNYAWLQHENFLYLETVRSHLIIVDREATSRFKCKEFY